jgi:hypothetical protein
MKGITGRGIRVLALRCGERYIQRCLASLGDVDQYVRMRLVRPRNSDNLGIGHVRNYTRGYWR